jgi:RNA recognition motif-containing protein
MRGPNVIYVGNLPNDIKERELQELFEKVSSCHAHGEAAPAAHELSFMHSCRRVYRITAFRAACGPGARYHPCCALVCLAAPQFGSIRAIDIKIPPRPPPFAFIEFNEAR